MDLINVAHYAYKKTHLEYRNAHYPVAFHLIIKYVEELIDKLHFLNMGLHLYRSKSHNYTYGLPLLYISFIVQTIQCKTSE